MKTASRRSASFLIRDRAEPRVSVAGQAPRAGLRLSSAGLSRRRRTLRLPDGDYTVECLARPRIDPERHASIARRTDHAAELDFQVERWIDPSQTRLVVAATITSTPRAAPITSSRPRASIAADMMRHCLGEDLKVGCNLTWGPCFDYQKQFFTGTIDKVSQYPYLLRYDIEVSGFGSHQSGPLCLLRLKEQMYPGGDSDEHWPTLGLNTLRWAKKQGAVCGPAHSRLGPATCKTTNCRTTMSRPSTASAPTSTSSTSRTKSPAPMASPCPRSISSPRSTRRYVGTEHVVPHAQRRLPHAHQRRNRFPLHLRRARRLGRSYVKLDGKLDYDDWCEGIRHGRNYVSDGYSHLMDFRVNDIAMGEKAAPSSSSTPRAK